MKSKYFTVDVSPTFVASEMEAGAYADGDVMFKSTAIEIPRGITKLIAAQVIYRGPEGVAQASTFDLVFTKDELTCAAGNAAQDLNPSDIYTLTNPSSASGRVPGILGSVRLAATDSTKLGAFSIATAKGLGTGISIDSVGSTVGLDKFYVHGITRGEDYNPHSNVAVNEAGFGAAAQTVIDVSGTSAVLMFAPGDVIHAQNNNVLGTIKTVFSATRIILTAPNTAAIAGSDGTADRLYCVNPMEIRLVFEK